MTKQEVLSMMMRQENRKIEADLFSLSARLAEAVAEVEDKLDARTLETFVSIGAAIYVHGINTFGKAVPVEDLFPAYHDWPDGPQPDRSGFRSVYFRDAS